MLDRDGVTSVKTEIHIDIECTFCQLISYFLIPHIAVYVVFITLQFYCVIVDPTLTVESRQPRVMGGVYIYIYIYI